MRTFQLGIKPKSDPPPAASSAWFIPGSDTRAWIDEAIACSASETSLTFFVIPSTPHDLTPAGVLLCSPSPFSSGKTCAAIPCESLGSGKLFFPSGADLHPPVTTAEIDRALPTEHYFLHPSLGLTAFDTESQLRLLDLLKPPTGKATDWSQAHPGLPPVPRLRSVDLVLSESIEDILDPGREDIGTKGKDELPRHPDEKKGGKAGGGIAGALSAGAGLAGAAGALAAGGFFKGIRKLTEKAPKTASQPTWVDRLQDWANKKLEGIDFLPQQQKEIERLLHLLETNPDEGLKYALPLNADGARGTGDLSSHLSRRNTDFSLGGLGGGQAYSPWDIDWQAQQRLTEKYREAANRELRLGRHRRAAYIFAELLNDRAAAADALKQGKHFREAGILYRDHVNRPLDAAKCFRRAGMIDDAIEIYEKQELFETLGDLFRELDREEDAVDAYRKEIVRLLTKNQQPLAAAILLESKLAAPEEALEVLQDGWSTALVHDRGDCLREEFALLERLARPEAARERVSEVCLDPNFGQIIPLVSILEEVSTTYFDPGAREIASDAARVVTGNHLNMFSTTEQRRLLSSIQRIEQQDLLLQRDSRRFTEQVTKKWPAGTKKKIQPPPTPGAKDQPILTMTTPMPNRARWMVATRSDDLSFFVAGLDSRGEGVTLGRLSSRSATASYAKWPFPQATVADIALIPSSSATPHPKVWVHNRRFLPIAYYDTGDVTSDVLPGSPGADVIGAVGGTTIWTLELAGQDLALKCWSNSHEVELLATHSLSLLPPAIDRSQLSREIGHVPMIAQGDQVIFAIGNHIGRLYRDKLKWIELEQEVLQIHASQPHTKFRLVATHEKGATAFWADADWGNIETFALEMESPVAGFTRSGRLVLASIGKAKSFLLINQSVIPQHDVKIDDPDSPIGVIDLDLHSFLVITPTQKRCYRFEKR